MSSPENIEEGVVAALLGIVLNPDDLGVVGGPGTDVLVGRVVEEPLGVADLGLGDAGRPLERQFHTPEASGPELGELLAGGGDVVVGALGDGGVHGGRVGSPGAEAELAEDVHGGPVRGCGPGGVGERPGLGGGGESGGESRQERPGERERRDKGRERRWRRCS